MCDGKGGEVLSAEREEFNGPTAEDHALIPWFERVWSYRLDGFCDEAHDVVGVIVKLESLLGAVKTEVYNVMPLCLTAARRAPAREKPRIRVGLSI